MLSIQHCRCDIISMGDNRRKLKGMTFKGIRYHISMLTYSQPEDNSNVANARTDRGCQGTRCYCWIENFLSSASGSCTRNPEKNRASRVLQPCLNTVYMIKSNLCDYYYVFINWQVQNQTGPCMQTSSLSAITSVKIFTHCKGYDDKYYICIFGRNLRVIYDNVFSLNCCGWRAYKWKPVSSHACICRKM